MSVSGRLVDEVVFVERILAILESMYAILTPLATASIAHACLETSTHICLSSVAATWPVGAMNLLCAISTASGTATRA